MQLGADPVQADQHDPEEARFQEEGGEYLQRDHRADRRSRHLPEPGEAEPELE